MLASLLPGLRDIRAPLAAGYVWLVVAWLILHERIDTGSTAPGAVDALDQLRDAIGVGGITAAATFVAYVLGALWEPVAVKASDVLWAARRSISAPLRQRLVRDLPNFPSYYSELSGEPVGFGKPTTYLLGDAIERVVSQDEPRLLDRISPSGWRRLWLIGQRLSAEVDETVRARFHAEAAVHPEASVRELERLLDGLDPFLTDDEKARLAALDAFRELKLGSARDSWWIREAADFAVVLTPQALDLRLSWPGGLLALEKSAGEFDAFLVGDAEVTTRLFEELPLVAFRLDAEQRDLFLEASRMKGEVEFRHTLAIPIPIAASVLAFGLGSPLWVWITATVAGIVGGWGLLADGWRRDTLRNDYLVELLAIGKATSPTFERLLERARGTPARGPGAPLDEAVASAVLTDAQQEPPEVVAGASRGHTQDPEKVRRPAASHAPGSASKPRRAVED